MAVSTNPGGATTVGTPLQLLSSNQAIRLIGRARGVSLNAVADTVIPTIDTAAYSVAFVIVTNASVSLAQAAGAVYTAAAAGGTAIVSPAALSACTTALKIASLTINSTDNPATNTLFFRCTTVNTAAATCDVHIFGYDFS